MKAQQLSAIAITVGLLLIGCGTTTNPQQADSPPTTPTTTRQAETTTTSQPPAPTTTIATPPLADRIADPENMVIVIDGWSEASLKAGELRLANVGVTPQSPLQLEPADAAAIAALAARDREAVRQLFARIVTPDPSLECDTDGCQTEREFFPWDALVSPGDGGPYGPQLSGWGIDHGVYVATVTFADGVLQHGSSSLPLQPWGENLNNGVREDLGVRAVGYGLGRLFVLEPAWLDNDQPFYSLAPTGERKLGGIDPRTLFAGLGSTVDEIEGLSNSLMTWRTSPTTGCGAGVLCVPGIATAKIESVDTQKRIVCSGSSKAMLDLVAFDVAYTYPAPTHQYGIWPSWGNASVGNRSILWVADVPFIEGPKLQRQSLMLLYGENGLVDMPGRVSDHDFPGGTTIEDKTHRYTDSDIERQLPGWKVC